MRLGDGPGIAQSV